MQNIEELMKAAQEAAKNVQAQMDASKAKLDTIEVEGVSGGGLVKVKATAQGRILGVSIDDSLMVASEKQMLEDLIVAAFNDARGRADQVSQSEMAKMTQELNLPPGFQLPF